MQTQNKFISAWGFGIAIVLAGCASSHFHFRDAQEYKSAALTVTEIEDSGEAYLANLKYENRSPKRVMILAKDIGCSRGDRIGSAKLEIADEILTIGPRETRELEVTCTFPTAGSGDYRIRIEEVYEQPRASDDSSVSRQIASDLEWDSAKAR